MSDLNLEEAIPGHLITERTQPLHGPDNFEPKMASYTGRLGEDIKGLVVLYLGVQAPIGVDKRAVIKNLRVHITDPLVGFYDEGFFTDINGYSNHLIAAYWKSKNDFQSWQNKLPVGWWYAGITPGGEIGVYWERYEPSIDDTEIIYSHDDRPEGWGNLAEKVSKPINKHGYWGSAQDRIPRSQTEDLKPTGSCQIINPGTGLLQVKPQENLVILRSAQDWSDTLDKERTFYKKGVEPVLMKGMKEIEDGLRLGCYFNRVVTLGDPENAQQKTYSVSAWHSMEELTAWVQTDTHLAIFNAGIAHYQNAGPSVQLRLHHEQMVVSAQKQEFYYFNCHKDTGMLRAARYNDK